MGLKEGGKMGLRDLGATHTLGRVGAQSKPEGISATLGNPCREVRLLQWKSEWESSASPTFLLPTL